MLYQTVVAESWEGLSARVQPHSRSRFPGRTLDGVRRDMPHLNITHTNEYAYHNPVGLLRHRLMIRPHDSHDPRLHAATLPVEAEPASIRWAHDVFGNSVCVLDWSPQTRAKLVRIASALELTHHLSGSAAPAATVDPGAEAFPFSYAPEEIPELNRLTERQFPDTGGLVDGWARGFVAGVESLMMFGLLEAMTEAVQKNLRHAARDAEGTPAPAETLTLGSGTCRDSALLMMEAVRSLGLAARFVTGYPYDAGAQAVRGGGAAHARCAVYLPGAGWVEYDPTSGIVAGNNLSRVGVARAPYQAMPVSGGFVGDAIDLKGLSAHLTMELTHATAALQAA